MLRELAQPSSALDTIYEGLIAGVHARICAIWGAATGQPADSEAVRLAVFATVGQIIYFHVGRPVVERRLGWSGIGEPEAGAIADTIVRNLDGAARGRPGAAAMTGFLCALPLIGRLVGCAVAPEVLAVGYVEGEYVNLAPVTAADPDRGRAAARATG